jgi:endonuclease YncB( thermonuclease family)
MSSPKCQGPKLGLSTRQNPNYQNMPLSKLSVLWLLLALLSGCQALQTVAFSQIPSQTWRVKPGSVHDGDTFRAVAGGEEIKVRLSCVDAPELKQAHGQASRDYLRKLLGDILLQPNG